MLRKKIAESLTARIFLITAGVLLAAGAITFSFIAWASPSTYTAVVNDDLTAQVDAQTQVNADLSDAVENSDDPKRQQDIARDSLGLVLPGEKILRITE